MAEIWPKRITVYAQLHYEYLYERGKALGLSEKAADYFAHWDETPLLIDVAEDGSVSVVPQQWPSDGHGEAKERQQATTEGMVFHGSCTISDPVTVRQHAGGDAVVLSPTRSLQVRSHSPSGFSWGYHGSSCAQLALALLLECVTEEQAVELYQDFKHAFVAQWPMHQDWRITAEEIRAWVATQESIEADSPTRRQ